MIHKTFSPLAGKLATIKSTDHNLNGKEILIEDWWDRVSGSSWMTAQGNPACMLYAIRTGFSKIPTDNEVLYGKINSLGYLIHVSEITPTKTQPRNESNQ